MEVIGHTPLLGALARRVAEATAPSSWGIATPQTREQWTRRATETAKSAPGSWLAPLQGALDLQGAARKRLTAVANSGGVLVTTGQQPGLFGGPLYTWHKALTALALANAIERDTGVPAAPLFWAATDDSDMEEAGWTAVALRGGAKLLRMSTQPELAEATPMALTPIGDLSRELADLRTAAGPAAYPDFLDTTASAYSGSHTVGLAYVALLRSVLEPLGIAVLDAGHPSVRTRADSVLRAALTHADAIGAAVSQRDSEIRELGMEPQVHEVAGLSLVFLHEHGIRRRIPISEAAAIAKRSGAALSPNVLLRPVVERAILPTVAYVGGPAELAYFAQSVAVSSAMQLTAPVAVPRFSGTIVEEHVRRILGDYQLRIDDLSSPHDAWSRLARGGVPAEALVAIAELRKETDLSFDRILASTTSGSEPLFEGAEIVRGAKATVQQRISRFERRLIAAAKRRDVRLAEDIATARGALFPLGRRQERALNMIPFLARHGDEVLSRVLDAAAEHVEGLLSGGSRREGDAAAAPVSAVSARD